MEDTREARIQRVDSIARGLMEDDGVHLPQIPGKYAVRATVLDSFNQWEKEQKEVVMNHEYVKMIETQDTGGHIMCDVLLLENGQVLAIADDSIGLYPNMDEWTYRNGAPEVEACSIDRMTCPEPRKMCLNCTDAISNTMSDLCDDCYADFVKDMNAPKLCSQCGDAPQVDDGDPDTDMCEDCLKEYINDTMGPTDEKIDNALVDQGDVTISESSITSIEAQYIVAAVEACRKANLTIGQLRDGMVAYHMRDDD